jgi:hypothetical protein
MNDRWGNINKTISQYNKKYKDEKILYQSAGALFKRKGDTPFKGWTVFLNRRGNLIISEKRCYFSNPSVSGRTFFFILMPLSIITIVLAAAIIFGLIFSTTGSLTVSVVCDMFFLPIFLLLILSMGFSSYQRFPIEISLEHGKMKRNYLGKHKAITRSCPMFSCYDGSTSYHFVGYRELKETKDQIENIFTLNPDS